MTLVTRTPTPPYRAVEGCMGHAFGYATFWEVVDANGYAPAAAIGTTDTIIDREWCENMARKLNEAAGC